MSFLNNKQRADIRIALLNRVGEIKCETCGITQEELIAKGKKPIIEVGHKVDGVHTTDPNDFIFQCHSCNVKQSYQNEKRSLEQNNDSTVLAKSIKIKEKIKMELEYLLNTESANSSRLEYQTLIRDLSALCDCDPKTTRTKLDVLTAPNRGTYEWFVGSLGNSFLRKRQ